MSSGNSALQNIASSFNQSESGNDETVTKIALYKSLHVGNLNVTFARLES